MYEKQTKIYFRPSNRQRYTVQTKINKYTKYLGKNYELGVFTGVNRFLTKVQFGHS